MGQEVLPGNDITVSGTFVTVPGGLLTNVTGLSLSITKDGVAVVGPVTPPAVLNPSTGLYTYVWQVPAQQSSGEYVAEFSGLDGATPLTASETFLVLSVNTDRWVTKAEVEAWTGVVVNDNDITRAQAVIDIQASRTNRSHDAVGERDRHFLKLATAYQAAWMKQQPGLFERNDVTSTSQDGLSASFVEDTGIYLSPLARKALSRLSWMRARTTQELPVMRMGGFVTDTEDVPGESEMGWHRL